MQKKQQLAILTMDSSFYKVLAGQLSVCHAPVPLRYPLLITFICYN